MKRKGLLFVALILAAVCVCCAALADDYPVNPYQEEVWEFDRIVSTTGKTREGYSGYYYDDRITITELQAPAIGQAGRWQVNVKDGLTVTKRSISIQSLDPEGGYSTEYRIKNPTSDLIESCEFVAPGTYRVAAYYDFSTGGEGSVAQYTVTIDEDGVHPTVAQKVQEILNECRVTGDDWQTALNLHDWLTHHAYYDYSYSFYGAEDVLMRGYGVCDSYSKAYAYLLNAAGITQERARSKGHAWNVITLGSEEYHVDATWDDGGNAQVPVSGNESHRYFCLNDELIYGFMDQNDSHKEGAKLTGRCTSLAESYPIHTGEWRNYGSIYVNSYTTQNYQDQILEGATGTENPFIVYANDGFPAEEAGYFYDASTIPALYDRYFLAYGLTHAGLETADGTVLDVEVTFNTSDLFFTVNVLGVKEETAITLTDEMITVPETITPDDDLAITVDWPAGAEFVTIHAESYPDSWNFEASETFTRSDNPGDSVTYTIYSELREDVEIGQQVSITVTAGAAFQDSAEWRTIIPVYPPEDQISADVRLTVPAEPLTANTTVPVTIEAPGAKYVSFFDGQVWDDGQEGQPCLTRDVKLTCAGKLTLMARAYTGDKDSIYQVEPEEWVYSAPQTRNIADTTTVLGLPSFTADEALMINGTATVAQGTPLTGVLKRTDGAETYTLGVLDTTNWSTVYELTLRQEDMENLAAEGETPVYGRRMSLATDKMAPGLYRMVINTSAEGCRGAQNTVNFTVTERTETDEAYLRTDKTNPLAGESVIVTAHIPGVAHIGIRSEIGALQSNAFCEEQEGDTGVWTVTFDKAWEIGLQAIGWTEERWNDEEIRQSGQSIIQFPDRIPESACMTVNVQTLAGGTDPDVQVTIPEPLTESSTVTVTMPACENAIRYSVICERADTGAILYSRESRTPFNVSIPGAWLQTDAEYELTTRIEWYGYNVYEDQRTISRPWAPIVPATIIPGEDVVITMPPKEGATSYEISVEGNSGGIEYWIEKSQPGTFVIPAPVFADGANHTINVRVSRFGYDELFWDYYNFSAATYTGTQALTIAAGEYTAGQPLAIGLSVTDAEQVIIQEEELNTMYPPEVYPYWSTVKLADNPGATVSVAFEGKLEHKIRAAVKKNGVWSKWSNVIEVSADASGKCNDDISWTLSSDGKLTITGSGEIPNEMDDEWAENFREAVTEVEIGNGITGIGSGVFSGHTNLTTVTIPASLKTIGEYAFGNCRKLTDILTPGGGDRTTYYRCYNGTEMRVFTLPSTVEELGLLVFDESGYGTTARPDMEIPANTSRIEAYAFQDTKPTFVKMVTWNVNGIEIGDHAFADCDNLRYFLIYGDGEDFNLSIADQAFADCEGLVFIGIENEQLRQFAESHGFTYIENEEMGGNG